MDNTSMILLIFTFSSALWHYYFYCIGSRNHILNRREHYGKRKSRLLPGLCEHKQSRQGEKISFGLSELAPLCGRGAISSRCALLRPYQSQERASIGQRNRGTMAFWLYCYYQDGHYCWWNVQMQFRR